MRNHTSINDHSIPYETIRFPARSTPQMRYAMALLGLSVQRISTFFVSSCSQLIQNLSSVIHSTNLSSPSSLRLERKQPTLLLFYSTHRHLFEITKKNQSPQNTLKTKKISNKSCPRVLFNAFQWPRFECGYLFISAKSYFGYGYLTKPANKVDIDILASGKTYHHCKIKETLCIPNLG